MVRYNPIRILRGQVEDRRFGIDMTEEDVDRILTFSPFNRMDPEKFPPRASLRSTLRNDSRIVRFRKGEIVVREADYGHSAFFIMSGTVRVFLKNLPNTILGRRKPQRKGVFQALTQLWRNPTQPEVRDFSADRPDPGTFSRDDESGNTRIFLQDLPTILEQYQTARMQTGEFFGEISALGRAPRTATVIADDDAELLEIRWQGLRHLRLRVKELRDHIDSLYRERNLKVHLRQTPLFQHLSEEDLAKVSDQVSFETYGKFDWYGSYKAVTKRSSPDRLDHEPIIVQEGHYPNGLILIRSGFARMSKQFGHGHRTVSYLGRGRAFGFEEISHNWRDERQVAFQHTLRAIGYVDILLVPTRVIEEFLLPSLSSGLLPPRVSQPNRKVPVQWSSIPEQELDADLMESFVEERFINGTATMLINLERCTGCDDCVRACAATHENNPRFLRHGKRLGKYMVANACMHCVDPVCMIGCPTGAIHRDTIQGQVVINDSTCIGCATCANNCPYDNIRMVDIRDNNNNLILDHDTHFPIQKATKCDLCVDQLGGPACQRACPHDALRRADMQHMPSLVTWLNQ